MKKEEFVKIGVFEELAAACEKAYPDELKDFVPRMRMNEVSEENKTIKDCFCCLIAMILLFGNCT